MKFFLAACFSALFITAVQAKHMDPGTVTASIYAACPTFEGALAVVTAQTEEERGWAWISGECFSSSSSNGVMVAIHAHEGMAVWGADGLDDMMVLFHAYDRAGSSMWTWVLKTRWDEAHPTLGASPSNYQI